MNPFADNTEVQQGSDEWLARRLLGIGGSEVAIILGISPYRTRYSLWAEKCRLEKPEDISSLPHVVRGVMAEPVARKLMEEKHGCSYTPRTWPQIGIARCSDDGSNLETRSMLEIKTMGLEKHQNAILGQIPDYYRVQCIWNLGVSGLSRCYFVSIRPEDGNDLAIVPVEANTELFNEYKAKAEEFWKLVESKTPPELVDADYRSIIGEPFKEAVKAYKDAHEASKRAERELEVAKEQLLSHVAKTGSFKGEGVTITRFFSKGSIEYKSIPELQGIDLEPYRKAPVAKTLITLEKKK